MVLLLAHVFIGKYNLESFFFLHHLSSAQNCSWTGLDRYACNMAENVRSKSPVSW